MLNSAGDAENESGFVNERDLHTTTNTMASRIGHPWTKQEEDSILADIEAGLHIGSIAVKQQRTTGGIRARLTRLACSFVEEKTMSLYEASGRTGIRAARIQEALKRKTEQETAKECSAKMEFNFSVTMSREELQDAPRKRKIAYLQSIVDQRLHLQQPAGLGQTSYLWEVSVEKIVRETTFGGQLPPPAVTLDEIVEAVRAKYPGCKVDKVEEWVDVANRQAGQPPTRTLKSGIKIDWS